MNATDGYSIHDAVFPASAMLAVSHALDAADLVRSKAGARHVMRVPEVRTLGESAAMLSIAGAYIGCAAFPFRATLFDKSLSANWLVAWHQDTALPMQQRCDAEGWGPWSMKGGVLHAIAPASALQQVVALRLHLDDSNMENGPLRVLPGTHSSGILDEPGIASCLRRIAVTDCIVGAGGVIAMRPLLLHASSKAASSDRRRVLHFEYASTRWFAPGTELAL
jgi:hypothetical protein